MSAIIILTNKFPFEGGEEFIEEEIKFWAKSCFTEVYLIPREFNKKTRDYPDNIKLIHNIKTKKNYYYSLTSLTDKRFYKEVKNLIKTKKLNIKTLITAWKYLIITHKESARIENAIRKIKGKKFIYSYWNDISCYAACILKQNGKVEKVFSRAHGYDIYKDRRYLSYMPYKEQFIPYMDKIYLLSSNALDYYKKNYSASSNQLCISRLGIDTYPGSLNTNNKLTNDNILKLLSLSYCLPVKQLDRIMKGVLKFAIINNGLNIEYTHIGGGVLLESLQLQAIQYQRIAKNLSIRFIGHRTNKEVHEFMKNNNIDIFINGSLSEGTPVSIMEAMSYGIPTVAPDIGGISSLVSNENGVLMPSNYEDTDLVKALNLLSNQSTNKRKSKAAKQKIIREFNSRTNYPEFINNLYRETKPFQNTVRANQIKTPPLESR